MLCPPTPLSFPDTHKHFNAMRFEAYNRAREEIVSDFQVRGLGLTCFCSDTLERVSTWKHSQRVLGKDHLNWSNLYIGDWKKHPRRFELAIWVDDVLCGVAVGRVSKKNPHSNESKVRIDLMEANPIADNPLAGRVTKVVFAVAYHYAYIIGRDYVCIPHPLNQKLILRYENFGFKRRSDLESFKGGLWFKV